MHVDVLFLKENCFSYPEILEQGLKFLSSAYVVSAGPTSRNSVCVFFFCIQFSRLRIG